RLRIPRRSGRKSLARPALQQIIARPSPNLLVSVLGDDRSSCPPRHRRRRVTFDYRANGHAWKIFRVLSHTRRNLWPVLAFRRYCLDLSLPPALPHPSLFMSSHIVPRKIYVIIWASLLLLLLMTWGIAQFDLGPFNTVAAITIAV